MCRPSIARGGGIFMVLFPNADDIEAHVVAVFIGEFLAYDIDDARWQRHSDVMTRYFLAMLVCVC